MATRPSLTATSAPSWTSRVWTLTSRPPVMSRSAGVRPMQTSASVFVAAESGPGMRPSLCRAGRDRLSGRPVADPVARPRPEAGGAVAGVRQVAAVERQAAAADALGQAALQAPELGDPLVDPRAPRRREAVPVAAGRGAVGRQLGELGADLLEREADALSEDDEGDPPQDRARIAAVAGAGALGGDQA